MAYVVIIHIIEDDLAVRESLLMLLEGIGRTARAYPDAEKFLNQAHWQKDDIVLIDLLLPGINGAEAVRQLQKQPEKSPKIIIISAQGQSAIQEQIKGLQVNSIIRKPLNEKDIMSVI